MESKLDRSYIGKEYSSGVQIATEESMIKYARATNETNPLYYDTESPEGVSHSPLYPVVFIREIIDKLAEEAEDMNLDLLRVVHAEQEMWWKGRILPGAEVITTTKIVNMEQRGVNELLDLHIECKHEGVTLVEMQYRLMMRGVKKDEKVQKLKQKTQSYGEKIAERTIIVSADQGKIYAEASGDYNPIHIDDDIARFVGLPSSILHGLCTMAFASQTIVDELLDGDPKRLRYIKVRFSKPVLMGEALTTVVYDAATDENGQHVIRFETKNPAGQSVLTNGIAKYAD